MEKTFVSKLWVTCLYTVNLTVLRQITDCTSIIYLYFDKYTINNRQREVIVYSRYFRFHKQLKYRGYVFYHGSCIIRKLFINSLFNLDELAKNECFIGHYRTLDYFETMGKYSIRKSFPQNLLKQKLFNLSVIDFINKVPAIRRCSR